jgi:nucleotide-binding universal stress UspA family protein
MKEITEIADRYDVRAKTVVHAGMTPDEAILAEAKKAEHTLLIMGVNRRPGDKLFFGEIAATVFEKAPTSVVFVVS